MSRQTRTICDWCGIVLSDESETHQKARMVGDADLLAKFVRRYDVEDYCSQSCFDDADSRLRMKNGGRVWLEKCK